MNPTFNTIPHSNSIPHGYDQIVATYGNPAGHNGNANPAWEQANLVDFHPPYPFFYEGDGGNTPITRFVVHRLLVPDLTAILTDVYDAARRLVKAHDGDGLGTPYYDKRTLEVLAEHRCNLFSGSFNYRDKRGQPGVPSVHSFGVALDFDAAHNAFGSQRGTLPDWFIEPFTDRGWEWGGQWHGSNKDWMHFERCTGY